MLRMTKSVFVAAKGNAAYFWEIRTDVPNRRVTTLAGRAGTRGIRRVQVFGDYETTRDHAEKLTEQKVAAGYEQVA